ncbi:MAG: hypothetical protein QNL04_00075 [SAR324 cluster bacterium]|nr:hypothetical protein [SAR324 cluster bacterium]
MKRSHFFIGLTVLAILTSFWVAIIVSDFFLDNEALTMVRRGIVYALAVLIPSMIAVKITGVKLGKSRIETDPRIQAKKKRATLMAVNGALIMVPAAFFLNYKASAGEFDQWFQIVQAIELIVGSSQYFFVLKNFMVGVNMRKERLAQA